MSSSETFPGSPGTLTEAVSSLKARVERLEDERSRLQQCALDLLLSSSWRMTAPLRALKRFLSTGEWREDDISAAPLIGWRPGQRRPRKGS